MKKYPYLSNLLKSIAFYGIFILLIYLLELNSPTQVHAPGLAILLIIFILPITSTTFFLLNMVKIYRGQKQHWPSLIIHLSVLIARLYLI